MKKSQKSLRDWTNQKWRTSDGSPSKGKKRYLPDAAWKALSPGEKAATNRAKAKGDKKGKQFVKQPENIAKKTAKYRAMGGLISSKFQNGGGLPKYETTLSLEEEANFMPWLESQYKAGNITKGDFDFYKKNNYGYNYDFRAAYKEGLKSSLNSKDNMQHWGDIGKKPNHPTFSNESKYHNVDGNIGGIWDGENFIRPYVAPYDLLEVEITPEGTELKDQPKELEIYYRDYAAQYPREAYIQYRKENPIGREKIKAINSKEWNDYIEKQANKEYKDRIRNYAAEQLLKTNPQGDRNRKEYLKSFTEQELAVLKNSKSKGKVNPTILQKFEGALAKKGSLGLGTAGLLGDFGTVQAETESLTDEEMKDIGGLDLLGPLSIPAKLVQAGYKDGYSFLDALKGQENDASLIEDIATDPLNLVGIGLVSKGANAAKLLKAYKNLSKLSNTKRASTLQNAYNIVKGISKNTVKLEDEASNIVKKFENSNTVNYPDTEDFTYLYRAQAKEFAEMTPAERYNKILQDKADNLTDYNRKNLKSLFGIGPKMNYPQMAKMTKEQIEQIQRNPLGNEPFEKYYGNWWGTDLDMVMDYVNNTSGGFSQIPKGNSNILRLKVPTADLEKFKVRSLIEQDPDLKWLSQAWDEEYIPPINWKQYAEVFDAAEGVPKSKAAINWDNYLTQEQAVQARAERMLAQKDKWVGQDNELLRSKFENAVTRHNPASETVKPTTLGVNSGENTSVAKGAILKGELLNDANKARVAGHETGHYYRNTPLEAIEWNSFFDFRNLKPRTKRYLRGKSGAKDVHGTPKPKKEGIDYVKNPPHANEIRERAAQLKDYIAQKNEIPLNQDFTVTRTQLDDALKNYVKDTGLDNSMTPFIQALEDKEGFLKAMNKYALGIGALGSGSYYMQNKEYKMGGTLDKSVMGYRDDSPYKNEPYIDINTPTGEIDMSKTGVSLYANGKLLKPYSGKHKFNTSKVREVPVSNSWLDKYK